MFEPRLRALDYRSARYRRTPHRTANNSNDPIRGMQFDVTALIERSINWLEGSATPGGRLPPVAERRHEALNSHFRVARKVMFGH